MPAKLSKITSSNIEAIRDAACRVLAVELVQYGITQVWCERFHPFNINELPAVNVCYSDSSETDEQSAFESEYDSKILVEVYTSVDADDEGNADTYGSHACVNLAFIIRSILMNDEYRYLDLTDKTISNRYVTRVVRTEPRNANDANTCVMATVELSYKHSEIAEIVPTGVPVGFYETVVTIENTTKGYKYGNI